jgi:hypothetical protein
LRKRFDKAKLELNEEEQKKLTESNLDLEAEIAS